MEKIYNNSVEQVRNHEKQITKKRTANFSYPSSAAAVVFSGYLSAHAAYRLDRKSPAVRPCV